jgi:peptide chain release factor 1
MYEQVKQKFQELEKKLMDPNINNDIKKMAEVSKEHAGLKEIMWKVSKLEDLQNKISQNKEVLETEKDEDLKEMARADLEDLEDKYESLKEEIDESLTPKDPHDSKNAIVEIRAGTGGEESALFAADLFRMYSHLAEKNNWDIEILDSHETDMQGFKEITFLIKGKNAYRFMKYERGTHRVQRVPETEKQGRVHTSAATVAVLPEIEKKEINVADNDIRIDTYSASGPGGQSVNTSNSAVRVTHIPTGVIAQCQDEKSQQQNKEKAMQILRARLYENQEKKEKQKEREERQSQIGSGDRSEKIRTYNFPQDRITDHRIQKTWHDLEGILNGGGIEEVIGELEKEQKRMDQEYEQ